VPLDVLPVLVAIFDDLIGQVLSMLDDVFALLQSLLLPLAALLLTLLLLLTTLLLPLPPLLAAIGLARLASLTAFTLPCFAITLPLRLIPRSGLPLGLAAIDLDVLTLGRATGPIGGTRPISGT
jgi:hypothetical protein